MDKQYGNERKASFQEKFKKSGIKPNELIGKYVKKEFRGEKKQSEHMWIKVTTVTEEGDIEGTLANNPCIIDDLEYGDHVIVKLIEIEDISI